MRIALADAGDSNDDANFEYLTANASILNLTKELVWIEETLAAMGSMRTGDLTFADRVFKNEISVCASATKAAYDVLHLRTALKSAWCAAASSTRCVL